MGFCSLIFEISRRLGHEACKSLLNLERSAMFWAACPSLLYVTYSNSRMIPHCTYNFIGPCVTVVPSATMATSENSMSPHCDLP